MQANNKIGEALGKVVNQWKTAVMTYKLRENDPWFISHHLYVQMYATQVTYHEFRNCSKERNCGCDIDRKQCVLS